MRVSELMIANVETCSVHDTVNRAAQIMWEADVGTVPVLEGPRVVGMITDRDVCMATYTKGRSPAQIPVTNAMSHHVISCRPDDKLTDAVALMREHRVRRCR